MNSLYAPNSRDWPDVCATPSARRGPFTCSGDFLTDHYLRLPMTGGAIKGIGPHGGGGGQAVR